MHPISRRALLGWGAAAAAGGLLARGISAADEVLASAQVPWSKLKLSGSLVLPTNASYPADKLVYNERFDQLSPAAIAYCQTPTDVQRCVTFAHRHHVRVAARAGGHSYGGYSLCSGLVIDVTQMASVTSGPPPTSATAFSASGGTGTPAGTVTVGAGTRLIDLYTALAQDGVVVPGGSCPTVGIAGLTLGGGTGVFARRFGLTSDQLVSLDLVTANGQLLTCDATQNQQLYWACRGGGGGNFGIATSFTFATQPMPTITLFTLVYRWGAAAEVVDSWQSWVATLPDTVWSNCQLLAPGSGQGLTVRVTGVGCISVTELTAILQPLRSAIGTTPTTDFVGASTYLTAMLVEAGCEGKSVAECHLPGQTSQGTLGRSTFSAKSGFVTAPLAGTGVSAVVEAVTSLNSRSLNGGLVIDSFGGAINKVAPGATAFVHRSALANIQYSASWTTAATKATASLTWLTDTQQALSSYVSGAYQNYIDPTLKNWQQAYYGSNLQRLIRIKRRVDPHNFFRFAQSIPVR